MNIIGVHKVHPRRKKAKFTAVDIADRREQESAAFMRRAVNTVHRRLERGRMRSMVIPTSTSVSHQLIASAVSNEVLSQDQVQAHIDGKKTYRGVHKWSPYERSLLRPRLRNRQLERLRADDTQNQVHVIPRECDRALELTRDEQRLVVESLRHVLESRVKVARSWKVARSGQNHFIFFLQWPDRLFCLATLSQFSHQIV